MGLARDGRGGKSFRDTFCEHFYITTSGFFSDPALLCCMMEMGIDRILFSVDYPFVDNPPGTKWTETLPLCAEDKEKLLNGNAKRLLKISRAPELTELGHCRMPQARPMPARASNRTGCAARFRQPVVRRVNRPSRRV